MSQPTPSKPDVTLSNSRPRIRHIALFARDPGKLAEFYHQVFQMEIVHKSPSGACFLTDGYLALALLPHRLEAEAAVGLNHFGFHVDDVAEFSHRAAQAPAVEPAVRRVPRGRPRGELVRPLRARL
jgi:catechol 2,3-dioxygenase-like lactoylglutathione lyase family enzyme